MTLTGVVSQGWYSWDGVTVDWDDSCQADSMAAVRPLSLITHARGLEYRWLVMAGCHAELSWLTGVSAVTLASLQLSDGGSLITGAWLAVITAVDRM